MPEGLDRARASPRTKKMSNAYETQIADAVVAELNAPQSPTVWSQTFTAARVPVVETQPKDLTGFKVSVVVGGAKQDFFTRGDAKNTVEIAIYIQCEASASANAQLDAAVALCSQFADYWILRQPAALPGPVCMWCDRRTLYSVEQLYQNQVATVPIVLSFDYFA